MMAFCGVARTAVPPCPLALMCAEKSGVPAVALEHHIRPCLESSKEVQPHSFCIQPPRLCTSCLLSLHLSSLHPSHARP